MFRVAVSQESRRLFAFHFYRVLGTRIYAILVLLIQCLALLVTAATLLAAPSCQRKA